MWTWVPGTSLDHVEAIDQSSLADDLSGVLLRLHRMPSSGEWNGRGRGGRPLRDSEWVRMSIARSAHLLDVAAATAVWERALAAAPYVASPVRIHGDPLPGNMIIRGGRLTGLIDISTPVVGDPASDLAPAWTIFDEPARARFRRLMDPDDPSWERGRGWAFEMAIGGLHYYEATNRVFFRMAAMTMQRLLES